MRLPKPNKIIAEKYVTGLSKFRNKAAKVKLSANESALGPSPKAIKEYLRLSKNFKRYPDSEGISLRKTIAKKFKLDLNRIILGSGSDQILELICKAFLRKGDEVIVPKYSFLIYRLYSQMSGAKVLYSKEKNFTISVNDILSKVTRKTKVVFLANPNNPTGTYISKKELTRLRNKVKNLLKQPIILQRSLDWYNVRNVALSASEIAAFLTFTPVFKIPLSIPGDNAIICFAFL